MGLGALSARISIILTKSFHIIHTRAQSPDNGSGACQYTIQGQMPFLPEPCSVSENLFTLYIQGLRALTLALVPVNGSGACQYNIQGQMPFLTIISYSDNENPLHNIHTRAQSPDTLLMCLSSGLGVLSTRISIILTKSFNIIHTRAQSPEIGSGACQYNIQGQMPFLPEPGSVYENVFALYIPRAQSPDIGFAACQYHIQGRIPLL